MMFRPNPTVQRIGRVRLAWSKVAVEQSRMSSNLLCLLALLRRNTDSLLENNIHAGQEADEKYFGDLKMPVSQSLRPTGSRSKGNIGLAKRRMQIAKLHGVSNTANTKAKEMGWTRDLAERVAKGFQPVWSN
jgi:hypothetical protein